jgi:hypothetical protein
MLGACGGGGGGGGGMQEAAAEPAGHHPPAPLPIQAGAYTMLGPIFGGAGEVVEAQYYPIAAGYSLFYGCEATKTCLVPDFAATPHIAASVPTVPNNCRFPYAFKDVDHFLVCLDTADGNLYLWRSTDLRTWTIQNDGQPILRPTPGTQWERIWNIAILPVAGRWHMLAETAPHVHARGGMDLAYAWIDPAVSLDFTPNQGPVVIPNGGNPELFFKNGKMVALHGLYHDRSRADPWYTTMSTADPAAPLAWTVRRDKLLIEQAGIDVCDPSYIELDGHALIAVSYAQNKVVQLRGPMLAP